MPASLDVRIKIDLTSYLRADQVETERKPQTPAGLWSTGFSTEASHHQTTVNGHCGHRISDGSQSELFGVSECLGTFAEYVTPHALSANASRYFLSKVARDPALPIAPSQGWATSSRGRKALRQALGLAASSHGHGEFNVWLRVP